MAKKIDVNEIVNKIFKNKINEEYKISEYLFKEKNNYCYNIKFLNTGNEQMATLNQIKKGTCLDIKQRKKEKILKTQEKLIEKNRLVKKNKERVIIPYDLNKKNVLSIDLATKSVGIAYSHQGKIVRWKTITSKLEDFRDRAFLIVSEIIEILELSQKLEKNKIDVVLLEDTYLSLNSNILAMLSEVRGMLTYHLKKMDIDLILIPPVYWKNKFEGIPKDRKGQKEFMMKKFFEYTGVNADSDDSADAYMMLKMCLMLGVKNEN